MHTSKDDNCGPESFSVARISAVPIACRSACLRRYVHGDPPPSVPPVRLHRSDARVIYDDSSPFSPSPMASSWKEILT